MGGDYLEEHRLLMKSRLTSILEHVRKTRKTYQRSAKHRAGRATREALLNARIIPAPVRTVLMAVAEDHGVTLEELTGASREARCLKARVAGVLALYDAFPGRPLVWYDKPFGYRSKGSAAYHLRAAGRIPPQPSEAARQ